MTLDELSEANAALDIFIEKKKQAQGGGRS